MRSGFQPFHSRVRLRSVVLPTLLALAVPPARDLTAAEARRPNVLFLISDDLNNQPRP